MPETNPTTIDQSIGQEIPEENQGLFYFSTASRLDADPKAEENLQVVNGLLEGINIYKFLVCEALKKPLSEQFEGVSNPNLLRTAQVENYQIMNNLQRKMYLLHDFTINGDMGKILDDEEYGKIASESPDIQFAILRDIYKLGDQVLGPSREKLPRNTEIHTIAADNPQDINVAMKRFDSIIHNLKGRFGAIKLSLESLEGVPPENASRRLSGVDESVRSLDSFLDHSSLFLRGQFPENEISTSDLEAYLADWREQLTAMGINMQLSFDEQAKNKKFILGVEWLKVLFDNLGSDAEKAYQDVGKPAGKRPLKIDVEVTRAGKALSMRIRDEGPGYPEEIASSMQFIDKFTKWENPDTTGTGTGMFPLQTYLARYYNVIMVPENYEGGAQTTIVLPVKE